ncbi:MAG: flagellar hook-length control protein FliK [Pseudomonadota bacterium]
MNVVSDVVSGPRSEVVQGKQGQSGQGDAFAQSLDSARSELDASQSQPNAKSKQGSPDSREGNAEEETPTGERGTAGPRNVGEDPEARSGESLPVAGTAAGNDLPQDRVSAVSRETASEHGRREARPNEASMPRWPEPATRLPSPEVAASRGDETAAPRDLLKTMPQVGRGEPLRHPGLDPARLEAARETLRGLRAGARSAAAGAGERGAARDDGSAFSSLLTEGAFEQRSLSARPVSAPGSVRDLGAVAERVEALVHRRGDGASFRLNLGELGDLDVGVRMEARQAHVHFAVQDPATRDLMEAQLPRLRALLEDSGLDVGEFTMSLSDQASGDDRAPEDRPGQDVRGERETGIEEDRVTVRRPRADGSDHIVDAFV